MGGENMNVVAISIYQYIWLFFFLYFVWILSSVSMDYKRYKLLFELQINGTDTFTSFSVPGSRDKWRHLWLQGSCTSYRLVLSAQKHVQFILAAQRGEQTASLKKTRNQECFMQKIADLEENWEISRRQKRGKNTHLVNRVREEKANKQASKQPEKPRYSLQIGPLPHCHSRIHFFFFIRMSLFLRKLVAMGELGIYHD